jgi:protein required for attachment to host cells
LSREVDPKEQEHIRFAEEIAAYLEHGRTAQEYQRLVLVAAPALLGLLRAELSAPLRTLVAFELDKDLTTLDAVQLRARLPRTI